MKKIFSLILAVLFVFSVSAALSGCTFEVIKDEDANKTPAEKFEAAYRDVGDEMRVGVLDKKFEIKDLNYADVTAEIEAPSFLQDENLIIDAKCGRNADSGAASADLNLKYKTSEVPVKIEADGSSKIYVSFPGVSEDYLLADLNELGKLGAGGVSVDPGQITELLGKIDEIKDKLEALVDKYTGEDRIKSEKTDVEVFGEKIADAEKLSVEYKHDDIVSIVKDITDIISEYAPDPDDVEIDAEDVDENAAMNVDVYRKDGKTVKAFLKFSGDDTDGNINYEMKAADGSVDAKLEITANDDGETQTIPITYKHTEDKGEIKGSLNVSLEGFVDEDSEFSGLTVDFEGTSSGDTSDMTYTIKFGGGGMTVEIPVSVKLTKTSADSIEFEASVDAAMIGVKLTVKGRLSKESVSISSYDPSHEIAIADKDNEETGERASALLESLTPRLTDFVSLIQGLLSGSGLGGLVSD